jgi:hypothetical protein
LNEKDIKAPWRAAAWRQDQMRGLWQAFDGARVAAAFRGLPEASEEGGMTRLAACAIRGGRGAKDRVWEAGRKLGSVMTIAASFACKDCFTKWEWTDFGGYLEPDTVHCSNCYGSKILITRIRIEVPAARRTETAGATLAANPAK